jgi:hypothetical protein
VKRKKSPLEGLKDHVDAMTSEERKKWKDDLTESMKEWRKKREEEERNEPPMAPAGKCMVCGGKVSGKYERRSVRNNMIGGPPTPSYWHFLGYNCERCGLSYKFPPPQNIVNDYGWRRE